MSKFINVNEAYEHHDLACWYQSSIDDKPPVWTDEHIEELLNDFYVIPKDEPTVDVIEVTRCKDCEWWTKQEDSAQGRCTLLGIYPTGAWYCGNGRRTEDD